MLYYLLQSEHGVEGVQNKHNCMRTLMGASGWSRAAADKEHASCLSMVNHQGALLASGSLVVLEQCQEEAREEKQKWKDCIEY